MRAMLWSTVLAAALATYAAAPEAAWGQVIVRPGRGAASRTVAATRPASAPAATSLPAEPPGKTLDECRAQYMRGQYSSAAGGYRNLLAQENLRLAAATGLSEALAAEGKYASALDALAKAPQPQAQKDLQFHLRYADVLAAVGQYEQALEHATTACQLVPLSAEAIFIRGRILETLGRKTEAVEVYKGAAKIVDEGKYVKDAPSLVALGQIMDRDQILTGKKASLQAQNILQNYFQEAYQKADAKYWPANVAAGLFCISKHRAQLAEPEFAIAFRVNPRIPDVFVGRACVLLENWDFDHCLQAVRQALAINPNFTDALVLQACCLMQWRKYDEVSPVLDRALAINPNHIDALSLYAAVHVRAGRQSQAQPYIDRVHKVNPVCEELPDTIAQWLSAGRQFEQALGYYQEAIKLAPDQAEPLTGLGLLYMQTGEEDKAREVLQKAGEIDDYRADVINYLHLLDKMAKFQVRQTPHFTIKVDGEVDAILLDQAARDAEQIYSEVCSDFDYYPKEKSVVEFFPTHEQFSIRITGKGWIGTVGASTGRVIAMVAPTPDAERSTFGTYYWYAVLRHEFTHTVTLGKTRNRIPHWFTEACAVWEQPDRRNFQATQQLVGAYRTNRLFPVRELDWGFIRPKRQGDRELAYAQAEWTMEYLIQLKKYPIIIQMLNGFRDGLTQKEVVEKIVGIPEEQFDQSFRQWAKGQIQEWGFDPSPPPDLAAATKEAQAKPKDADAQARLAYALLSRGNQGQAEAAARSSLAIDANQKLAMAVLTSVLATAKKSDEALSWAKKLQEIDIKSKVAPRVIADISMEKRQWAQAIEALEQLRIRSPLDEYSYSQLATCYMNIGQPEKALPNLIEVHEHTMNTPVYARRIADICRSLGQNELALKYYNDVTRINPYETNAYQAMAAIHLRARRYPQAVACAKDLTILAPQAADSWLTLAKVELYAGRAMHDAGLLKSARTDAQKALAIEASDQTRELIQKIDEAQTTGPGGP